MDLRRKKQSLEKEKKILKRKVEKIIKLVLVTSIIGTGLYQGYQVYQNKTSEEYQVASAVDNILEQEQKINDIISKLGNNIYKNLTKKTGSEIIGACKKGTGNGNFFYDFDGVSEKYETVAIEKLQQYSMTQEEATRIWSSLSEEEQAAIIIDTCISSIKNYAGGDDNKSNFIYKLEGSEASHTYELDNEEYLSQKEEKAKESSNKLAQIIIEKKKIEELVSSQEIINPNILDNQFINSEEINLLEEMENTTNNFQGRGRM